MSTEKLNISSFMNEQYMERRVFTALASTTAFDSPWPLGAAAESTCSLAKAKAAPLMLTKTPFVYSLPHVLSFLQPTSLSRWKTCVFCAGLHKWHGLLCGHFYRLYNLSSLKACLDEYQCNFPFNLIFEAKTDSLFFYSAKQVPDPRLSRHYC